MTLGQILTGILLLILCLPVIRVILQPVIIVIGMIIYGNKR